MRRLFASLLCAVALQAGCSEALTWRAVNHMIAADYPDVTALTTDSLAAQLADSTSPTPVLLDARSPDEYAVSHLRGARRVSPSADAYPALDTLASDAPIVVYCSVGYRSAGVVQALQTQGFSRVYNLKGSIFRWANEGRPVYRNGEPVSAVHPYDVSWGQLLTDSLRASPSSESL
ncbi:rhodanese-like domain-containing protein [Salinibacter ruber]|uniref:rhodanese-like domain-containing protein n=1 Tax=Salinibacter ruber TaxID=146919 RepID=UPI0021695098|nr:rhodanese-like domain-containing protein [Salinibacter ruber]MCS4136203.1 rhodanese-related sulfurtransferase [Salinibacter ruber]